MIIAAAVFALALAGALRFGDRGVRVAVLLAILLAPLRGGLLDLGEELPIDEDLVVNALGPAIVAGAALAMLLQRKVHPDRLPPPLVIFWAVLAAACALDFLTQDVGLKLYAVGLAQYLTYPTMAILLWMVMRPEEEDRLVLLLVGLGVLVSVTLFIQAADINDFVQAAPAYVAGLDANRWAGITGSYLHTSVLLGPIAVLALGLGLREGGRATWQWPLISFAVLATLLSAQILTFSRSGLVTAAVGMILLLVFSNMGQRIRLVAIAVPAVAVALFAGSLGGVDPSEAGERFRTGVDPITQEDAGNTDRLDSMEAAVERYGDATLPKQVLGEGIGSTGNARKLIDENPLPVESYYLKVLLETGLVGFLLIVPMLLWATATFGLLAWRALSPADRAIGAAGFGFSLHLLIYPTLEVQVLSAVWWTLLVLCLRARERAGSWPRETVA